jgi:hypothetical protein
MNAIFGYLHGRGHSAMRRVERIAEQRGQGTVE